MDDSGPVDRRTVLGSIGTGSIAGLTGCFGGGERAASGEAVSVTGVWTGGEEEDFGAVVEHVEDETGLEIRYEPRNTESILTGTLLDYESGVATADVVVMPSPARIRSDADAGHLVPLGDTWDPEGFAPDPEPVTVDGEVYAAPFKMDLKPGFWYRESFFDDHGLSEPADYDGFLDLLGEIEGIDGVDAPLASGNGEGWPLSDVVEAFVLRREDGGRLQRDLVAGEARFTDDRVLAAFEEVQALLQRGYFSELRDFGVQYEYFWENRIPLYFMGSWTPGFEAIEDPEDLDVFVLPGTETVVASVNWFTVPEYSERVDAARTAVEGFVSAGGQRVWAERGGFVASTLDVPGDAYALAIMRELSELAATVELVPDLDDALGDPFQSEFWSQLTGLWTDPDTEVEPMLERLDGVLRETVGDEEGD